MSDQLQMFEEHNYQKLTQSLSDRLAKILVLLENVKGWEDNAVPLLPKQFDSSMSADHVFLSGKMLKEHSLKTMARTFGQLSKPLPTLGVIDLNGNCLIQSGFYPKTERESTLSDILETDVQDKYFLSEKVVNRLMSYKDNKQTLVASQQDMEQTETEVTLLNVNSMHKKSK